MSDETGLSDILAIRGLIDRYSDAVNRRDISALAGLWHPDGRWSVPEVPGFEAIDGVDAITATWLKLLDGFSVAFFLCAPGDIRINGDVAKTINYGHEVTKTTDGQLSTAVGSYSDKFVKTEGGWRFAERAWTTICRYFPQQVD